MRFVEVVLTTAILAAPTARAAARDDPSAGTAAEGPGGALHPPLQRQHEVFIGRESPPERSGTGRVASREPAGARRTLPTAPSTESARPNRDAAIPNASPQAVLRSTPAQPRLALAPHRQPPRTDRRPPPAWFDFKASDSISTMVGGLAIVVGVFLLFAWAVRKRMPQGSARLPDEIIEVLGRTTLAAKQSLHLVRIGGKLIVVSVTAAGTETLTEITDAGEVARILAACQQHHLHSSTTAFRQVFEQLGREPASGFLSAHSGRAHFTREGTGAA